MIIKIEDLSERLKFYKSHLKHPRKRLEELSQRLDDFQERLILAFQTRFKHWQLELKTYQKTLQALSPLAVLERGYSISYLKDKSGQKQSLKNIQSVEVGMELETQLFKGVLKSKISEKLPS